MRLLKDSRDLYVIGFYACVAMCGIAAERLVKDFFRSAVGVGEEGYVRTPGEKALDQVERVEISGLIRFFERSQAAERRGGRRSGPARQLRRPKVCAECDCGELLDARPVFDPRWTQQYRQDASAETES